MKKIIWVLGAYGTTSKVQTYMKLQSEEERMERTGQE